ncbi:hypothetical protein A235_29623, partial [Pseudomonas syringae pv. actinidiae ICMP 19079]
MIGAFLFVYQLSCVAPSRMQFWTLCVLFATQSPPTAAIQPLQILIPTQLTHLLANPAGTARDVAARVAGAPLAGVGQDG